MYLKNQQSKYENIKKIIDSKLEIQEYFINGDRKPHPHQNAEKWKFDDKEILNCKRFKLAYIMFFSDILSVQLCVGMVMMGKLKLRKKLREEVT